MPFPSGLLAQQPSGAERERAKSNCLTGDLVETRGCQFAVEACQRIRVKPRLTCSEPDRSQYLPDAPLEGFQSGIENWIENLMQGPVVIRRDDQMPARFQDT